MPQVIAITGTPGTGKTAIGKLLAKKLGARLIDLNKLITEKALYYLDSDGVKVARLKETRQEFAKLLKEIDTPVVVEGLLSHLLGKRLVSKVVVLRTHPRVLRRRLIRRGYRGKKLEDNLESEALDIILWESVHIHGKERVLEVDTTGKRPSEVVSQIFKALKGEISLAPGKISWLEEYFHL